MGDISVPSLFSLRSHRIIKNSNYLVNDLKVEMLCHIPSENMNMFSF